MVLMNTLFKEVKVRTSSSGSHKQMSVSHKTQKKKKKYHDSRTDRLVNLRWQYLGSCISRECHDLGNVARM